LHVSASFVSWLLHKSSEYLRSGAEVDAKKKAQQSKERGTPMRRRFAVVGDKLNNDGEIIHYIGMEFTIGNVGRKVALIGGAAYCPVCKTNGYIARNGGPGRMTLGSDEIALDKDWVVCRCPERPHIVALLAGEAWHEDVGGSLGTYESCATSDSNGFTSAPFASSASSNFDELFRLLDSETGEPLASFEYAIERANGEIEYGLTDKNGNTHLLSSTANAESINLYL
jgi:hypothetical protein